MEVPLSQVIEIIEDKFHQVLKTNYIHNSYKDIDVVYQTTLEDLKLKVFLLLKRYRQYELLSENRIQISTTIDEFKKHLSSPQIVLNLDLSNQTFNSYNFDDYIFINVRTHETKFNNCRMRNAAFLFCDMRYSNFNGGTFEGSILWFCDLYRAYFEGLIRFSKVKIENCSLNNAFFSNGVLIRKINFQDNKILQENKKDYRRFLIIWDAIRPNHDKIKNDSQKSGEEKIDEIIFERFNEIELIYKNLTSTFTSNGFSNDTNWAYVKGRRAERYVFKQKLKDNKENLISKINLMPKIFVNKTYDMLFGYGESLVKICVTYFMIVIIFTIIYMYHGNISEFFTAFRISLGNMVGISSKVIEGQNNIFLDMLNLVQTTFGILITGIFGFILGNKIRNQ